MRRETVLSHQDFQIIKSNVRKTTIEYGSTYGFDEDSHGYTWFILDKYFLLQEDEILEAITDTHFQGKIGKDTNPDRGIDAVIIDEETDTIHLFNFKYKNSDFEKVKNSAYEGSEIDKILAFISDLYQKNVDNFSDPKANSSLRDTVHEIWRLIDSGKVFKYNIHFSANIFKTLEESIEKRLRDSLVKYKQEVVFDYILIPDIIDKISERNEVINCKFRSLNSNFFDKSESGRRALVIEIPAIDLLRMVSMNSDVRTNCDSALKEILKFPINDAAFSDNVRMYLKNKTNVNENIINTALDATESAKIFFYNNGITITCDKIDYQGDRNVIVGLSDIQIVNGGQTIHALRSAFESKPDNFNEITVLCKIFETTDPDFKLKIAEYTNSQNPVKDRDIRSIDSIQIKLEADFLLEGYFYARKKYQHENELRSLRIDAEKLGQALLAHKLDMPAEAKNKKSLIFGAKYDELFNSNLLAHEAVSIMRLYADIEERKLKLKKTKSFLSHATYYIMFFIKKHALMKGEIPNIKFYDKAVKSIEYIIKEEKKRLKDDYVERVLFVSNRPKEYLSSLKL